jgi:hypothetical protein
LPLARQVGVPANTSNKVNDGAGLGTRRDSDGVRIGSVSERLVRRFRLTVIPRAVGSR